MRQRLATLIFGLVALTACSDARLLRSAECGELERYVADAWLEQLVQTRYGGGRLVLLDNVAAPGAATLSSASGPPDFSTTNVQEAGVDEADLVETDGSYIYVVDQRTSELLVVRSWPAPQSAIVGRVAIGGAARSMFVHGDQALVISDLHGYAFGPVPLSDAAAPSLRMGFGSRLSIVDLSDRSQPVVVREIDLEGTNVHTARRIGDDAYVVMNAYTRVPDTLWSLPWDPTLGLPDLDWQAGEEEQEAIRAAARAIFAPKVAALIASQGIEGLLPRRFDVRAGAGGEGQPLVACSDVYHPKEATSPTLLAVAHLDLGAPGGGPLHTTAVMAAGSIAYASSDHLYVAQPSWGWWRGWGELDRSTRIHRFALAGASTAYEGSGEVGGWLLNSFSMGEHEGVLRVATTDQGWWWGLPPDAAAPANNLFNLRFDGVSLSVVGELRGIAPNEQIRSARFLGDIGFLVTFRQIDPLFALDLSDPEQPRILGEVELTGFSSYLHPIDRNRLLGIGMDATPEGRVTGLSVTLFDVADLAAPRLLDRLTIDGGGWSSSEALWDHHAVTFHRGVLAIPAYAYDAPPGSSFSGLLAITAIRDSLVEIGRVDHGDLMAQSRCLYGWPRFAGQALLPDDVCRQWFWYAQLRRSVVIEDRLYSISDYGIKVNELRDLDQEVARVLFHPAD